MKEFIKYYYLLDPPDIIHFNDNDYFIIEGNYYLISESKTNDNIDQIILNLNKTSIPYHLIILNKDGKRESLFQGKSYSLLKMRIPPEENIPMLLCNLKVDGESNWSEIWEQRLNYYDAQLAEIVSSKMIKIVIPYFLSLAEIAIYNFNKIEQKFNANDKICTLTHQKISYPNYAVNFYNPYNYKIDYEVRDIGEYIKQAYFFGEFEDDYFIDLIDKLSLNDFMANMLIVRLLYPNYFFNYFDDYIVSKEETDDIFLIIKKSNSFTELLKKIIQLLANNHQIIVSVWFKYQY